MIPCLLLGAMLSVGSAGPRTGPPDNPYAAIDHWHVIRKGDVGSYGLALLDSQLLEKGLARGRGIMLSIGVRDVGLIGLVVPARIDGNDPFKWRPDITIALAFEWVERLWLTTSKYVAMPESVSVVPYGGGLVVGVCRGGTSQECKVICRAVRAEAGGVFVGFHVAGELRVFVSRLTQPLLGILTAKERALVERFCAETE